MDFQNQKSVRKDYKINLKDNNLNQRLQTQEDFEGVDKKNYQEEKEEYKKYEKIINDLKSKYEEELFNLKNEIKNKYLKLTNSEPQILEKERQIAEMTQKNLY